MIPIPRELRPCPDCHKDVLWTVTRNGKRLLVDGKPDDQSNPGGMTPFLGWARERPRIKDLEDLP
ncbi:hypothetical protein [Streptomyces malaysiensis]|uniref:Uncharacterized protein n=1 Tax=Streptomyces malaysiensis subsp. samsunensis TaxID=459658 RepID=A0A9X2M292_STRMQ|nr:hypothetical protein [Streptomyces samsunensis]